MEQKKLITNHEENKYDQSDFAWFSFIIRIVLIRFLFCLFLEIEKYFSSRPATTLIMRLSDITASVITSNLPP